MEKLDYSPIEVIIKHSGQKAIIGKCNFDPRRHAMPGDEPKKGK